MKTKKFSVLLLLGMFSTLVFNACTPTQIPISLTVDKTEVKLTSDGSSDMFRITSNTSWIITGSASWLKVEPATGEGDKPVALIPEKNTDLKPRVCTLKVSTADGTICQNVKVVQGETEEVLEVSVKTLLISSSAGSSANFEIRSNDTWKITDCPDWLELSTISGTGNNSVVAKALTTNYSAADRSSELTIKSSTKSVKLTVSQKAAWLSNCVAKPVGVTILCDCAGFGWDLSSNVAYYYYGAISKSEADRMTTMEKVSYLVENGQRDTPGDNYISSVNKLSELTNYELYTVAFDKDGVQGDLFKQEFRTKSSSNQPYASIEDVSYTSSAWYWSTYIGPYASAYYMWAFESLYLYDYSDGLIAYVLNNELTENPEKYSKILQSGNWSFSRSSNYLQVITWGISGDGALGGYITRFRGSVSSNSTEQRTSVSYIEYKELISSLIRIY